MKPRFNELKPQIAGLALALSLAAASAATEPKGPQTAPPTDARQQLLDLEKQWADAEDKSDTEALRRILDDRFVATLGARTYDKDAFIKAFAREVDPSASQTLTYEAVIIDGDTAVLIATDTARGTRDGTARTAVYKYTATYIRRDGRWRALAEHIVKVPPPPPPPPQ
jgi:ketosteroid isomerase-like protein